MPSSQKQLFYKLEPEGCWCELNDRRDRCITCDAVFAEYNISYRGNFHSNPDFSTWDGFGWMIERAKKAEWWDDFLLEYQLTHEVRLAEMITVLTSPTALRDALMEYHGIGKEG